MSRPTLLTIATAFFFLNPQTMIVGQDQSDRLTTDLYLEWERVSDPRISPDGTQIIYTRQWVDKMHDRWESALWIMNADGTRNRFLTEGSSARWSPDGTRILFLKEGDPICTVKGRAYRLEKHAAAVPDRARAYPISVLVNGISASGAELMSGVLQHYSKSSKLTETDDGYLDALVLGVPTFGKGTVQHTRALESWPGEKFVDAVTIGMMNPGEVDDTLQRMARVRRS